MPKKSILFVDDEPNILSGIKRMLRSLRHDFDFHFSEDAKEGLSLMDQVSIDVVVSDMRMPGMDGAEFLTETKTRFPHTIRIMLTGQADEESVMRTVGVVHQFLSKPCEPNNLKEVLIRSCTLHDILGNEVLKNVISGLGTLPSLPEIYSKLQNVLKNPDATTDEIGKVVEQDIAMTAKLLHLVNSSFFGLFQKVETPARAVNLLGIETVKALTLGVHVFSTNNIQIPAISLEYLWRHSMAVAQCSKKIALSMTDDQGLIANCFIAGVLHDIGRLLLVTQLEDEYSHIVESAMSNNSPLISNEIEVLHASHSDVGAYLLGLWGFNGDIVEAIAFHNSLDRYPGSTFSTALAIHVADYCYYLTNPSDSIGSPPQLDMEYIKKIGLGDNVENWISICETVLNIPED